MVAACKNLKSTTIGKSSGISGNYPTKLGNHRHSIDKERLRGSFGNGICNLRAEPKRRWRYQNLGILIFYLQRYFRSERRLKLRMHQEILGNPGIVKLVLQAFTSWKFGLFTVMVVFTETKCLLTSSCRSSYLSSSSSLTTSLNLSY